MGPYSGTGSAYVDLAGLNAPIRRLRARGPILPGTTPLASPRPRGQTFRMISFRPQAITNTPLEIQWSGEGPRLLFELGDRPRPRRLASPHASAG